MERAYTVAEIDALRSVCKMRWLFGTTEPGNSFSRSYKAEELDHGVEQLVRTYMLAGLTAGDILEQDRSAAKRAGAAKAKE